MDKVISFLHFIFYISVLFLIAISLFPGSLIGFFLYGDLERQPNIIQNPFGTAINHFLYFFYVSILGLFLYLRKQNLVILVYGLFFLSIILELLQFLVPKRTFEIFDLSSNFVGVLSAFFLIKIYKFLNRS